MKNSFLKYKKAIIGSLKYSFKIAGRDATIILVLGVFASGMPYLVSYMLGILINVLTSTVNSGLDMGISIIWIFLIYSLVDAIPDFLGSIRAYFSKTFRFKFQSYMEVEVLRKREEIDIAHYENPDFQDLYQRAFQRSFWPVLELSQSQFFLIKGLLSVIIGSVLATNFNPAVFLVIFLCAIPKFIVEYRYGLNIYSIWMKDSPEQRRFADLRKYFLGRNSLVETKLLQSKKYLLSWFSDIINNFNDKQIKAERIKMFMLILTELIASVGFIYGSLIILKNVVSGEILIGSMVYFISILGTIKSNFAGVLVEFGSQGEKYLIVNDLLDFFETKPFVSKSKNPIKLDLNSPPRIVFENVSFKYPNSKNNKFVLKNINLTFESGKKIGLVGNNGAGKTTFIKLLSRIYDPTEGRILINGIDLKDVDLEEWWNYLSIMLQDYSYYDFPVKDTIAIGRSNNDIDIERVIDSAKISQADEFIDKLDKKYDNPIGTEFGGVEPSKGQRQKLAIAKTLYRKGFVMILDEPTASVDAESESKIFKSLNDLPNSMTLILISHDFSMIKECDQIFVFKEGMLEESGSHNDLMSRDGLYKELFDLQAEGFK